MTTNELLQRLEGFPQAKLGNFPTPLEKWERLGKHLGHAGAIYGKREDLTGLAFGGNKTRQLEFLLGDALEKGADTIVHGGAVQSNYSRTLAAACAKLGLRCHLVLSTAYGQPLDTGNFLLDRLSGAHIELTDIPLGEKYERRKQKLADEIRRKGGKPYLITYPRSEILGTLAYIKGGIELYEQCRQLPMMPSVLALAAVGSTQSGLLLASRLLGWDLQVIGFSPLRDEFPVVETLKNSIVEAAKLLNVPCPPLEKEIISLTDYVGEGYGKMTAAGYHAIRLTAQTEGVFLDPVYNGKAASGLFDLLTRGSIETQANVVFVHTGGNIALFAYNREILEYLDREDGGK